MGSFIDLTGQKFGRLTVLGRAETVNKRTRWKCKCDCGNETTVEAYSLRSGQTTSCGCYQSERASESNSTDISGKKFGRLTAIRPIGKGVSGIIWECTCECGNKKEVAATHLLKRVVKSCGCLQDDSRHLRAIDLTGQRFGRLIAKYPTDKRANSNVVWHCVCDCGSECEVAQYKLSSGETKSCGCFRSDVTREIHTKWITPEEQDLASRFDGMMSRCYNTRFPGYEYYGARGIYICDEWLQDRRKFIDWSLENGYDKSLTIDRINNDGPYAPWNCRWVTSQQQCENRRNNVFITVNGDRQTITEWSRRTGTHHTTLSSMYSSNPKKAVDYIISRLGH